MSDVLQFHGHHSYFRKDYHMLLAVKEDEIQPPHRKLGQNSNNSKIKIFLQSKKK